MAAAEEPQTRSAQLTLGAALYRTGDYARAIEALQKAWQLGSGGPNGRAWLFLAMAHWRLGEAEVAREWLRKAVEWIDENRPDDKERRRLRSEAEELLGLTPPERTETPSKG